MRDIFNDRQIVVTGKKTYSNFHTPSWMSMIVNVTSIDGKDKKWLLNRSTSSVQ